MFMPQVPVLSIRNLSYMNLYMYNKKLQDLYQNVFIVDFLGWH